jgi:uncharacterized short protein YbdD (DUF466 family)
MTRRQSTARDIAGSLGALWRYLREVSGDDAYERYLAHHALQHAGEPVMSPQAFFLERQRHKWTGVSRCC